VIAGYIIPKKLKQRSPSCNSEVVTLWQDGNVHVINEQCSDTEMHFKLLKPVSSSFVGMYVDTWSVKHLFPVALPAKLQLTKPTTKQINTMKIQKVTNIQYQKVTNPNLVAFQEI